MAELADFSPDNGHRHDCRAVRRSLGCSCALQLYEAATDISMQLAECDQAVRDAEG